MTFSICVCERIDDGDGRWRFGVAVTTRLPGVGRLCPFASENGAIATQSLVNVDLGRRGIGYVDEGLGIEDALRALLNADDGAESRQVHGVDREGTFAFSGDDCRGWFGHLEGEGYTIAGNLLTGELVLEATAEAYEASEGADRPLAGRLIDALAAGQEAGGDRRTERSVQSAALRVASSTEPEPVPAHDDLRVDASEEPITELRETYELARRGRTETSDHETIE
jgi:uncharacterized Ntn-hydrolase superfamily protein